MLALRQVFIAVDQLEIQDEGCLWMINLVFDRNWMTWLRKIDVDPDCQRVLELLLNFLHEQPTISNVNLL